MKRENQNIQLAAKRETVRTESRFLKHLKRYYWLYIFLIPGLLNIVLFKVRPLYGLQIAFRDYSIVKGITDSDWVGLKHFVDLFKSVNFRNVLRNSIVTSILSLLLSFPAPIILALLMNEVRNVKFKRSVQTIVYMPHFLSWVVVCTIMSGLFSQNNGVVNNLIVALGGDKVPFLTSTEWYRTMLIGSQIWKEAGYGTIIYMAALAGVDVQLYEAAEIDGANRWHKMRYITLPCIAGTVAVMLIMKLGRVLNNGFEQSWLLMNATNKEIANILETYSYEIGLGRGEYSFASAIGFFQSLIGMALIFLSNYMSKRTGGKGLW